MAQEVQARFILVKTLARFAFAALVLAATAAHAQPGTNKTPTHGVQGNDYNWMEGGGG